MRILIVNNVYPPYFIGGYELGCRDVARELERRGHRVTVLTSCHGVGKATVEGNVFRWLHWVPAGLHERLSRSSYQRHLFGLELKNQLAFDRVWHSQRPDVVYLWNLARIPISLALRAESRGAVCYYVSDEWLSQWTEEGWYEDGWYRARRAHSKLRARLAWGLMRSAFALARLTWTTNDLQLRNVQFCSAFLKQATLRAGRPVAHGHVVHWGVDVDAFSAACDWSPCDGRYKRLLYVGQVLPRKGVHTAIEAMYRLCERGVRDVTLTIVGDCHQQPDYEMRLRQQVAAFHLEGAVRFLGRQPRERLPEIYREHGVLIFPSCWDEPFAITPLEAMASGLAVVGTTAGGSREIFEEGANALIFREEDSQGCAEQVHRLTSNGAFARDLAERGRHTVLTHFTLRGMVDRIDAHLHVVIDAPSQRRLDQGQTVRT
jgi:glycogen synthase